MNSRFNINDTVYVHHRGYAGPGVVTGVDDAHGRIVYAIRLDANSAVFGIPEHHVFPASVMDVVDDISIDFQTVPDIVIALHNHLFGSERTTGIINHLVYDVALEPNEDLETSVVIIREALRRLGAQ